jgi:hypothetical protein
MELADFIARRLFENGSCGTGKRATRLEWKHEPHPKSKEIGLGGYSEGPLADAIADAIGDYAAQITRCQQ